MTAPGAPSRPRRWTAVLWLLALAVGLAGVVYPLRRYVLEPRRQSLLGQHEPPGRRLALCAEFAFSTAAGASVRLVPGRPVRELADLPAEAITLLLGGFRGPYVVYLWTKVEEEKEQKVHFDLIDRYTKIAALQSDYPEMWVFHAWNLAWNVSVQWQSLERKYQWIRRSIAFLREGYRKNPHSAQIVAEMGRIYTDKLGKSREAFYYRRRVQEEEGRSPFLIGYEWYDLARTLHDQYGTLSGALSPAVVYSQACHSLSYYARERTQKAYDALEACVQAREAGRDAKAREAYDEGVRLLDEAIDTWAWAQREWHDHAVRFEKEDAAPMLLEVYRRFHAEAGAFRGELAALRGELTYDTLPQVFSRMRRPEIN